MRADKVTDGSKAVCALDPTEPRLHRAVVHQFVRLHARYGAQSIFLIRGGGTSGEFPARSLNFSEWLAASLDNQVHRAIWEVRLGVGGGDWGGEKWARGRNDRGNEDVSTRPELPVYKI